MSNISEVLEQIRDGEPSAAERLLPLIYTELRKLAALKLAQENPGQTLQATALVHEAYLRLAGADPVKSWDSRGHFFAAAGEAMRRILVDQARHKKSLKRGGHRKRLPLEDLEIAIPETGIDLLAVNDALDRFEKIDPQKATLVKLRYFSGFTIPQVAEALGISPSTADRYWAYARAWLHAEIKKDDPK